MKKLVVISLLLAFMASCDFFSPTQKPSLEIHTERILNTPVVIKDLEGNTVTRLKPTTKNPAMFLPDIAQRMIYLVDIPGRSFKAPVSLGPEEAAKLIITDRFATGYEIKGSEESQKLFTLNRALNKSDISMRQHMKKIYQSTNKGDFAEIRKKAMVAMEENRTVLQTTGLSLIREDYGALANTLILQQVFGEDKLFPVAQFTNLYDSVVRGLQNKFPENDIANDFISKTKPVLRKISLREQKAEETSVGNIAPDIRLPDKEDEIIALHQLESKSKVLAFWDLENSSSTRTLKSIAELISENQTGTSIYAVSLHPNTARWRNSISDHPVIFHVSEPEGLEASSAKLYGVSSTPLFLLLNQKHEILLRTSDVEEIKEHLGKQ